MSALREFITLLWKNWIVQKRRRCVTAFEVILPLLFWAIVIILRVVLSFFGSRNTYSDAENTVLVNKAVNDYRRDSYLILYTPNTTAARQAVELLETFNVISNVRGVGFASEEDLVRAYESGMYPSGRDLIGVVFDGNFVDKNSIPRQMTMTIRQAYSYRGYVNTRSMFDRKDGSCYQGSFDHLYVRDFVPLQYGLMRGITELQAPTVNLTRDVNISLHRMPCKDRTHDEFFDGAAFEISVPVLTVFCYLIFAVQITQNIVSEKQKKLTIWLQMLGVREKSQWIAWFVKWLIQLTILNIIITVLAAVPMPTVPIVGKSQASLFFLLMVFYSVATIAFCFMISSFFQKATPGAVASAVFFLLTYMPYIGLQLTYERRSIHSLLASSLLHNVALGLGCQAMTNYQTVDEGVQWTNFFRPAAHEQDLSFLLVLIMLLVDSALYLLVTWYVRGVFPGRHGVALSWYFPFTRSYWRRSYRVNYEINTVPLPEGAMNSLDAGEFFQADPTDKSLGIAIRGLRKVFGSGKSGKVAVADVVLNVYKGQITALLGHNGAGKTTTLSMLTGFLPPTSGTATINGQDIRHNPDVAAKTVGLCPQDDILFDLLTVREHLVFFAKLRGERPEFIDENVYQVIHDLGLGSCAHKQVGRLSGGKRRAVSVAIALLTSSQIVILDEPTSGMDPASRHQVWSALQKHKEDKAILFTTHNMDEADSPSDRVAIMSQGVIKCSGSPLYLKNNYGVGYHLRILKGPRCDVLSTKNLVTEHVPDAVECCNLASALVMTLPKEHSSRFYILFGALEKEKERLDIENFSVAFTTMEDVFLRFGRSTSEQTDLFRQVGNSMIDDFDDILQTDERRSSQVNLADSTGIKLGQYLDFNEDLSLASGWSLAMKQFRAGVYKKCLLSWRNPFLLLVQIIATIILVSVGYGVATIGEPDQPPLDLDTTNLWENEVPYDYDPEGPEARKLVQGLLSTLKGSESVPKNVGDLGIKQYLSQKAHQVSYATYTREFIVGQTFRVNSTVDMRGFYNSKSSHGIAVSLSTVMNTLLKYYVHPESSVKIINHPLPEVRDDDNFFSHTPIFSIVGAFSLGLLSSTFIVQLLKERNSKAKHIQIVSGMKPWVYWLSTFAWDMVIMLIPIFCLLIVIAAFDDKAYIGGGRMGYVFFVLLLYAWATLPFTYLWSFIFKSQVCGFVTMLMLNILSGPVLLTVIFVASMFNAANGLRDGLGFGFGALLPNVALGTALSGIARNYGYAQTCSGSGYCRRAPQDYLGFVYPGVGGYLLILFFQGIVYFLLVLAAEYPMSHRKQNPVSVPDGVVLEDEDVRKERNRIMSNDTANTNSLVIQNLSRRHGSKIVSVNNISLGVSCDECFGLLGANGAGKTTTFRILSGEDRKFSGEAFINGKSVSADLREAYGTIGYCTQKDTLLHLLTGRETLTFFAHLKGVHDKRIKAVVDELLATLFLQEDADKLSDIYSIGNKRKLSTAIALLGDPPMLLLDEPTAGVDPVAKRRVWNVLTDVRASGRTILLTSHSMEECDALCTRLSIMVNGRLMCLGSPQHLKNKFGQGYTLTIRVEVPNQSETSPASDGRSTTIELQDTAQWTRIQAVKAFLTSAFPSHKLVPCADDTVKCNLSDTSVPLSYVFRVVEEAKERLCIADYSVNQTSLEDVFLYLASYQLNPSVC